MPRILLRVPERLRAAAQLTPRALLATMRKRPAKTIEGDLVPQTPVSAAAIQGTTVPALTSSAHTMCTTTMRARSQSRSNRRELTKDALLVSLEALVQSADAFPPLKSAVGGLLFFVTQVEIASSNQTHAQVLYAQVDAISASLVRAVPDATELSPVAKQAIHALADDVQAVCVDIRTIARQRSFVRFLRAKRNQELLQAFSKRLDVANTSFTIAILLSAETKSAQVLDRVLPMRDLVAQMAQPNKVDFFFE